jgi:hypothetical protein
MNFTYSSNLQSVVNNLKKELTDLQSDKLLRTAALDAQAIIQNRVQQEGRGADDSLGSYSSSYAEKRREAGRQTRIKDLTFSGDLFRNWVTESQGSSYTVGFASKREADKADWLEARFGRIFYLASDEQAQIEANILTQIAKILK